MVESREVWGPGLFAPAGASDPAPAPAPGELVAADILRPASAKQMLLVDSEFFVKFFAHMLVHQMGVIWEILKEAEGWESGTKAADHSALRCRSIRSLVKGIDIAWRRPR